MIALLLFTSGCQTASRHDLDRDPFTMADLRDTVEELREQFPYYHTPVIHDNQVLIFLKFAAERNSPAAQYYLGLLYYYGQSVKKDLDECVYWIRRAANAEHTKAQLFYGFLYLKGIGVAKNFNKAKGWLQKAAAKGNSHAKWSLANIYLMEANGGKKALGLFRELAKDNHPEAQFTLGQCYRYGTLLKKNLDKAEYWYKRAAKQNHAKSIEALEALRRYRQKQWDKRKELVA